MSTSSYPLLIYANVQDFGFFGLIVCKLLMVKFRSDRLVYIVSLSCFVEWYFCYHDKSRQYNGLYLTTIFRITGLKDTLSGLVYGGDQQMVILLILYHIIQQIIINYKLKLCRILFVIRPGCLKESYRILLNTTEIFHVLRRKTKK